MNREERMEQRRYRESEPGEPQHPAPPTAPPQQMPPAQPPQHGLGPHTGEGRGEAGGGYASSAAWTNPGGAYGGGLHGGHGGESGCGYSSGGYGAQGVGGQGYAGYAPYGYGQAGRQGPTHHTAPYIHQHARTFADQRQGPDVTHHPGHPGGQPRAEPSHGGAPPCGAQGYGQQGWGPQSTGQGPQQPGGHMGYSGASYGSEAYGGWAAPGSLREEGREVPGTHPRHRRGPKGYTRSDLRLMEEICDRLVQQVDIDPSDVEVRVQDGIVDLEGTVESRASKHRIEDIVDAVWGVKDIRNHVRVPRPEESERGS